MVIFSTMFYVTKELTKEKMAELAFEWVNMSPHYGFDSLTWNGEDYYEQKCEKQKFSVIVSDDKKTMAIRLENRDGDILWTNDFTFTESDDRNLLFVRLNRDAMDKESIVPHRFHRPRLMKEILRAGYGAKDNTLQISDKEVLITRQNITLAEDVICGKTKYLLPIVYVTKRFMDSTTILDTEELAKDLAGTAHVLVEESTDITRKLKRRTGGKNPFNGAVHIYYTDKAGNRIIPEEFSESNTFRKEIVESVCKRLSQVKVEDRYTWETIKYQKLLEKNQKYKEENTELAEACYITGLERNADVVTNISYAPLLFKVGSVSWDHDLIYFDEFHTAKSTNYYVQQMFANNYGTDLIQTELQSAEKDYSNYGSPILGGNSAAGSIDKVTVYDKDNKVLLEDDFNDASNPNGWAQFGSGSGFTISGGRLNFTGTSGVNAVYLPKAVEEKWKEFRIEVEGLTKTSGNGGFVIGAGHGQQYYWFNLGKDGAGSSMEATRPERNASNLTTKTLGNHYPNKYYNTGAVTRIQSNDPMHVSFNYGVGHKLEAKYTSTNISSTDTAKYDFSSELNQYQTDIYQVVNKDDSNVYIKLVNPDKNPKDLQLHFENLNIAKKSSAAITMLTGGLDEANAIGTELVAPVSSEQKIENHKLFYQLPAYSVNVIRLPLAKSQ